jgi:hypothetical protein
MVLEKTETKNDYTDESQQQFNRPTELVASEWMNGEVRGSQKLHRE